MGFEQLGVLLRQFDGKRTTAQAIEATFKIAPAAFDKEFDTFVRTRFANVLANFEDWQQQMRAALESLSSRRTTGARAPRG